MRISLDVDRFATALEQITAEMAMRQYPPTEDEIRARLDGLPPIWLVVDGRRKSEIYIKDLWVFGHA